MLARVSQWYFLFSQTTTDRYYFDFKQKEITRIAFTWFHKQIGNKRTETNDWIFLSYQTLDFEDAWKSMTFKRFDGADSCNAVSHSKNQILISVQQRGNDLLTLECQKKSLLVKVMPELHNGEFSVYLFHGSSDFTAEDLTMELLNTGILGVTIRSGLHT